MHGVHVPRQGACVRRAAAAPRVRLLGGAMRQEDYTAAMIGFLALIVGYIMIRSVL